MHHRKVFYSDFVERDIEELSDYGFETHGRESVIRYNKLIKYTIDQLRVEPDLENEKSFLGNIQRVHLRKYKNDVIHDGITVQSPSHYIFYRILPDDSLEIVRIMREGRLYEQHLKDFS